VALAFEHDDVDLARRLAERRCDGLDVLPRRLRDVDRCERGPTAIFSM
jgi:hypothetical protein